MRSRYCILTASSAAVLGCSLLAPDDEHFLGGNGAGAAGGGQGGSAEVVCAPAPPCATPLGGPTVTVTPDQASELSAIVAGAAAGTVVSLAAGTYPTSAVLSFKKDGVTLTSASGSAADVIIDGGGVPVVVAIGASDVTLRGITLRGGGQSAILLGAGAGSIVERPRLCGVRVEDGGTSFVQAPADAGFSDCGRIEASELVLTDSGRTTLCPSGLISGVSVQGGRGWVLTGTTFRDFYCASPDPPATPLACGTVGIAAVFSAGARDTVVENNRFLGVARALALGYTITTTSPRVYADQPYPGLTVDHYDGVVRNNVVVGQAQCFDTGFELNHARRPEVLHNSVTYLDEMAYSAIDRRYPGTEVVLQNNLYRGKVSSREGAAPGVEVANVLVEDPAAFFVDASAGDLHLLPGASAAIDQGVVSPFSGLDIDGQTHAAGSGPDVGADER